MYQTAVLRFIAIGWIINILRAVRRYHGAKRKAFSTRFRKLLDKTTRRLGNVADLSPSEFFWLFFRNVMTSTPSHSRTHSRAESMTFEGVRYQPLHKIQNSSLVVTVKSVSSSCVCQTFIAILKSALPYLLFLALYGANDVLHVLPRYDDLTCIKLNNISALEYSILRFSPHKFISSHHHTVLDFLAAVPYLLHYTLPVVYPIYLLVKRENLDVQRFYWLLGWIMWFQYAIWFFFPTAPPWFYDNMQYYAQTGSEIPPLQDQHKEGCAFGRIDHLTGVPFFFKMFGGNPVPFGAFPSGHVAWPTTIFVIRPPGGTVFALYVLWVAWATLYSCHHYLTDAVGAVLLVICVKKLLYAVKDKTMTSLGNDRERLLLPGDRDGAKYSYLCSPCKKVFPSDSVV